MALFTLRAAGEVRASNFGVAEGDLDAEMVAIAGAIIGQRTGHFDPSTYRDRYQNPRAPLLARAGVRAPAHVVPGRLRTRLYTDRSNRSVRYADIRHVFLIQVSSALRCTVLKIFASELHDKWSDNRTAILADRRRKNRHHKQHVQRII